MSKNIIASPPAPITCIYKISNHINNRVYIGSAVNYRIRRNRHVTHLNTNKHCNKKLQRFVNKYGMQHLVFSIVEECSQDELLQKEQYYIDLYKCVKKGFNILPTAASWLNMKHSLKSKAKQSSVKKGKATTTGMKLSAETKDKIRQKAIGRKQSPETIRKRVEKNRGKIRPREAIDKTIQKTRKLSDEQVVGIKSLLWQGQSQEKIAKLYGVCQRNISRIKQGISYTHVN